jgi:aminoglycoside phosphotransferase (APT) family kinase protein
VPRTDNEWDGVARHLALVHSVTPAVTNVALPPCTIDVRTAQQGQGLVREHLALLPEEVQPKALQALVRRLEAVEFPEWDSAPVSLCRLDNNIANYVRRSGVWASVDWEYSGWGDPAFDVANLITHVALKDVPAERWDWFVDRYCALVEDETARRRIGVYRQVMLAWWAVRLARYLYEIPSGADHRLAAWPEGWRADIEAKYTHYLALAQGHTPSGDEISRGT